MSDREELRASGILPINKRVRRAEQLLHAIMAEFRGELHPDDEQKINRILFEIFERNGAYIMDDEERSLLGLEPRDDRGWTFSERIEENILMTNALLSMSRIVVPVKP